jgi:putative thioredoxin
MSSPHVLDVTAVNFQDVVARSRQVPILLDFWADWCAPCRALTPVLERLAEEYGGAFLVGKVDTERERELAHAFRVQSIPFGCLIADGRPVDAFTGAIPERELRAFLARSGIEPAAPVAPVEPPDSPRGRLRAAKTAISRGDLAEARRELDAIPDDDAVAPERDRLRQGLTWLAADLAGDAPAAMHLRRARDALREKRLEPAMQEILESVRADRGYGEEMARRAMLLCFALAGEDTDLTASYRRRLATLLY